MIQDKNVMIHTDSNCGLNQNLFSSILKIVMNRTNINIITNIVECNNFQDSLSLAVFLSMNENSLQ